MVDVNYERLQAAAQENWRRDLQGGAQIASGLAKRDLNGICRSLFGKEAGRCHAELSTLLGVAELVIPGTTGNYASTPDHASLDVLGDIDIRADVALTDWTPAAVNTLVAKRGAAGQRSYHLRILTSGLVDLLWSNDGTTVGVGGSSSVAPSVANGARLAVRATLDVDNGATGHTATFYTAPSIYGPWTQLGTPVVTSGVTSIFNSSQPLELGTHTGGTQEFLNGRLFAAEVRNGIAGTIATNPFLGAIKPGSTTFTDSTGKVYTLFGTAAVSY